MTRFQELCQIYKQSRDEFLADRDEVVAFTRTLLSGFITHLGLRDEQVEFIRLTDDADPKMRYTLPGAMTLQADGWWRIGFGFTVYEDPNTLPQQPVLVRFKVKKNNGGFAVEVSGGLEALLSPSEQTEFADFYSRVFEALKFMLQWSGEKSADDKTRRIVL